MDGGKDGGSNRTRGIKEQSNGGKGNCGAAMATRAARVWLFPANGGAACDGLPRHGPQPLFNHVQLHFMRRDYFTSNDNETSSAHWQSLKNTVKLLCAHS